MGQGEWELCSSRASCRGCEHLSGHTPALLLVLCEEAHLSHWVSFKASSVYEKDHLYRCCSTVVIWGTSGQQRVCAENFVTGTTAL